MQYNRSRTTSYFSGSFPPAVKWLLILNTAVFLLNFFVVLLFQADPFQPFGLRPSDVVGRLYVWQLVTYMFLHGGVVHILFNMLALWMFGADLERDWGSERFLKYYFLCGVGAAISVIVAGLWVGDAYVRTIGASGAVYGILLAFGVLYPDRIVLFSFLFPMKAKWFVLIIGVIVFINSLQGGSRVSHVAHLGGMVFGYIFLKMRFPRMNVAGGISQRYRRWKADRARRKFQVYMRRRESDRDRWVH